MKTEKIPLKSRIIYGITAGTIYAVLMELFYLYDGDSFSIWRFLLHGVLFGLFMSFFFRIKKAKK